LALIGSTFLAIICAWLAFRLSFYFFVWRYPHDGQDMLGSVALAILVGPAVEILGFILLFLIQRDYFSQRD
jgi:hypothetical protein